MEEEVSSLTLEEKDAMDRSRKKVRAGNGSFTNNHTMIPRDEPWMHETTGEGVKTRQSERPSQNEVGKTASDVPAVGIMNSKNFKQAVTRGKDVVEEEEDWWSNDEWKEHILVVMTPQGPNVIISDTEKTRLAQRWQKAVIVKLLGRMIDAEYLERKLQQIWGKYGDLDTIDVGSGFFVVNFTDGKDYELALTGGPWLIFDHYLAIQP